MPASLALIRSQVEARLSDRVPAGFEKHARPEMSSIASGIEALDRQTGGIPCGAITELVAPPRTTSGRTSLQIQLLARASRQGFCALVDASDRFDPRSGEAAGVDLKRLLWVRCSEHGMKALEQAFRCADLLVQASGGFRLIVVDVADIPERFVRKVPLSTWFRFCRVVERLETALLFSTPCAVTSTCCALGLTLQAEKENWSQPAQDGPPHARLLSGFEFAAQVARQRPFKKPPQAAVPRISVRPKWA